MDMSKIVEDWTPDEQRPCASLFVRTETPIILDLKFANASPPYGGSKILLIQARAKNEELWAIRMLPSGRLLVGLGTAGSRETGEGLGPAFAIAISYNPRTGRLLVLPSDGAPQKVIHATARNAWAPESPKGEYAILIGAPEAYADKAPLGWKVSVSFRYGESIPLMGGGSLERVAHAEVASQSFALNRAVATGGHIGLVPWSIAPVGNNLQIRIGSQPIDVSTKAEATQVFRLFAALTEAILAEVLR